MAVTDANFYSLYSVDKIIGILEGSFTAGAANLGGYLYQYPISQPYGRPVFCELMWSEDGTNYLDGGSSTSGSGNAAIAYSDSSNIYVTTTKTSGAVYYRVIMGWIDNYDSTSQFIVPSYTTSAVKTFDSRLLYQKVHKKGKMTFTGTGGTIDIAHPLGYAPKCKVFFESIAGQVWPSIAGGVADIWLYDNNSQYELYALSDTSKVSFICQGGPTSVSARAWYRIYYDQ